MKVDFWQLGSDPADKVVTLIAQKVCASGERLLVVSGDKDQLDRIGKSLWHGPADAFLANGRADADHAARQPILLSDTCESANEASHIIFADGVWREEAAKFARSFLLFGENTLDAARVCWRSLDGGEELERSFYRQDGGKWTKVG